MRRMLSLATALMLFSGILLSLTASATPIQGNAFQETWDRTDRPVATGAAVRSWMWGPEANGGSFFEAYDEGVIDGHRRVLYFDKSRMEIPDPNGDPSSIWYVTNGLLVRELISGELQTGDASFEHRSPAHVNVAGDLDGATGPTYATFSGLLGGVPSRVGDVAGQIINRTGVIADDPPAASIGITFSYWDDVTQHNIAQPFWDFMNSTGVIFEQGQFTTAPLFVNPFYATGRPITEAYWANVKVAGTSRIVLIQCFERRCLTYTWGNPPEWQVEMGNVGQHYYAWRYGDTQPAATGDVQFWNVAYDSPIPDEGSGEYVVIQNMSDTSVQLYGWRLEDVGPEHAFTFPNRVLMPGQQLEVYNCTGTNDATHLYTGECQAWWNNGGDTAYLYNAADGLVSSYTYP